LSIVVDAEIISLDAFNRSHTVGIVAIAFVKVSDFHENLFNVFSILTCNVRIVLCLMI